MRKFFLRLIQMVFPLRVGHPGQPMVYKTSVSAHLRGFERN